MSKKTIYILLAVIVVLIIAALIWVGPKTETSLGDKGVFSEKNILGKKVIKPLEESKVKDEVLFENEIRLEITANGFTPKSFRVKGGQEINLFLLNMDAEGAHGLEFDDFSLKEYKVIVPMGKDKIQAMTFITPEKVGDYIFSDMMNIDLTGIMRVE